MQFLVIQTLDLDPDPHWPKMLDPNLHIRNRIETNADSKHCWRGYRTVFDRIELQTYEWQFSTDYQYTMSASNLEVY